MAVDARKIDGLIAESEEFRRQRRFPQAIEKLNRALTLQPSNSEVNFALGTAYAQVGQPPLAIKHLRTVLATEPDHSAALSWLATLLSSTGRLEEAEQIALKASELHPEEPAVHNNLGRIYLETRKPEKALVAFQKAVAMASDVAPLHARLGQTQQILGRFEEAAIAYRKGLDLAPEDEGIRNLLVRLLMSLGHSEEALQLLEEATRRFPDSFTAHTNLAQALFESEAAMMAIGPLTHALQLNPNSALAHGMLGACLSETGKFEEAVQEFRTAIRLDPSMGIAYYDLVESKTVTEEDLTLLDQMLAQLRNPNLPPPDKMALHFGSGKAFDDLGRYREAMEQFDLGNRICRRISFDRPFDRKAYAEITDEMIAKFPVGGRSGDPVGDPSSTPIFVVGMIRSGTTLIERILASHPDVAAGGELKFLAAEFDRDHCLGLEQPGQSSRTARDYLRLLDEIAQGKTRVTDKMPSNFLALGPILALFPNAKIVHVRRNPVDTCISIYSHLFHNPPEFCCDRENIVFGYQEYQRLMSHWRTVLPKNRFFEVEYEKLIADKKTVVRALIDFCELEWDDRCLRHEKTEGQIRTVSKRQARQPLYTKSVQRWKNYEPWLGPFTKLLQRD